MIEQVVDQGLWKLSHLGIKEQTTTTDLLVSYFPVLDGSRGIPINLTCPSILTGGGYLGSLFNRADFSHASPQEQEAQAGHEQLHRAMERDAKVLLGATLAGVDMDGQPVLVGLRFDDPSHLYVPTPDGWPYFSTYPNLHRKYSNGGGYIKLGFNGRETHVRILPAR